jgi:hypothetical protein
MGEKSGRNEREAGCDEGIIAELSRWRRGRYRFLVEAMKKEARVFRGRALCWNRWPLSAEDHTLPVRVAGAVRIERTAGLVTPGWSRQSATAATPIDHHGHDSHAAQAVTMPGHPSPTRQWTARDATPVPASSGPTVPECRAAQVSPAEREGVTRTLQGETRVAGDVSDMQPAACSTLNQK